MNKIDVVVPPRFTYATFDGLRGVAALAVIVFHLAYRAEWPQLLPRGYLAVDLFFALSGFVIAQAYSARLQTGMGLFQFTAMRLVRLYPLFFLGQLLGLIVFALHGYDMTALLKAFIAGIVLVPWPITVGNVPPIFPLNGPSWSLFFEIAVNIAFAAVITVLSRKLLFALAVVSGLALAGTAAHFGSLHVGWNPQNFIGGVPRVTFSFVIGILILRFAPKVKLGSTVPLLLALAIIPILAAGPRKWWIDLGVVTFIFPALVYYAASWQPTGPIKLVAQWLGRISYPLYIIHMPALYFASAVVAKWELSGADKAVVFAATVLGTILISALLPRFYDEPIRRAASKMINRNTARSEAGASSAF